MVKWAFHLKLPTIILLPATKIKDSLSIFPVCRSRFHIASKFGPFFPPVFGVTGVFTNYDGRC